jgi:hypothetical protein
MKKKPDPVHDLLVRAIATKSPVSAVYRGRRRVFCPHVFGYTNGRAHCLMFQVGGESRSGLSEEAEENWRCVLTDELSDLALAPAEKWVTPANWSVVHQSCVSEVVASGFPSGGLNFGGTAVGDLAPGEARERETEEVPPPE